MANPTDRSIGGTNSRLYVDGVYVGMVQNATFSHQVNKVAINEAGSPRTREHIPNGVVCSINIGFVVLKTRSLESMGLLYPTDEGQMVDFEQKTLEFRTNKDELIVKAEGCTPSSNQLTFTRDTIWGRNVTFDATWFYPPESA